MSKKQEVPISSLHEDKENTRFHSQESLLAIRASIERFGQVIPIVVDSTGKVLAGNGTFAALRDLGFTSVKVTVFEGSDDEARAFAIADNHSAEMSSWNVDRLAASLLELKQLRPQDLPSIGFSPDELAPLFAHAGTLGNAAPPKVNSKNRIMHLSPEMTAAVRDAAVRIGVDADAKPGEHFLALVRYVLDSLSSSTPAPAPPTKRRRRRGES